MTQRLREGLSSAGMYVFLFGALLLLTAMSDISRRLEAQREGRAFLAEEADALAATPVEARAPEAELRRPDRGSVVGRIVLPDVGIDVVAFEGVDRKTLDLGAGHFPRTALPGEPGNSSFAAHRDVEFRGLRAVRNGHDVWVDTAEATYVYRVAETRVVEPSEIEVLDAGGRSELTLITCYPFDWVGPAPKRFVVTAHLRGRFDAEDRILDEVLGSEPGS